MVWDFVDVVVAFSGVAAEDEFDVGVSGDDDAIDAIAQLRRFEFRLQRADGELYFLGSQVF